MMGDYMQKAMRASQVGLRVLREMPSGADNATQAWLLRGGFLYQQAAGIYCFTPLMYRVEQKLSALIADEITREGGAQVRLPILQSADLWKQSGRWDVYRHDRLMFQLEDRKGREFGLSPTAEEAVCDLAKHMIASAKQLPLILFQQNFKFRDELRPRSGLLRSREFIMMDAYSFDLDEEGLDVSYRKMSRAYHAIFSKLGMRYITVEADSGAIGGSASEEFMSISDIGEDTLLFNDGYAANVERATSTPLAAVPLPEQDMTIADTPGTTTIGAVADYLGVAASAVLKSLVFDLSYADRTEHVVVLIRGDDAVNPIKLANHFGALEATGASPETVKDVTGTEPGWVGPVNLPAGVRVIADRGLEPLTSLVAGCCREGKHAVYARPGRDFPMPVFADLRTAQAGETGPNDKPLEQCRGIEVGHVFKLGTKYSVPLNAGVTGQDQTFQNFQMGCYGIGTTRVISALVDQNCDDETGIIWPIIVAPFHVQIVPLKADLLDAADALAEALAAENVESLVDDRAGSLGSRLADADILGLPFRIVLGRDYANGQVEFLNRLTGESSLLDVATLPQTVGGLVRNALVAAEARRPLA